MADCGKPGVDSRDEGKHTGRNDLLFVIMLFRSVNVIMTQLDERV